MWPEFPGAMGIDGPGRSAVLEDDRSNVTEDGRWCGDDGARNLDRDDHAAAHGTARCARRKRPFVARVAAKPTLGMLCTVRLRSRFASLHGWSADRAAALEDIDDDHRCAAMAADQGRAQGSIGIGGLGAGSGYDVQQRADSRETGAAHGVGQQSVVKDTVETTRQHVQQEMK
jgi:hypothetical protein